MLVILPFEKEFYKKWNYDVEYVGHPLVEVVDRFIEDNGKREADLAPKTENPVRPWLPEGNPAPSSGGNQIVALLPGSRKQEIMKKLPIMLEVSRHFPECRFVVAQAPGQEDSFYQGLLRQYPNVSAVRNRTYELLLRANAACVTSGTATLETALFGVPEVICYKGSPVSFLIAKRLIKVKYISLVNLIMDKPVVKELIQDELTVDNLRQELNELLGNERRKAQMDSDYRDLKNILGIGGHASANAARAIIGYLMH